MTGGLHLALSPDEENEIGPALADCLDTLPTPIAETIGKGGPWLKLGSVGGKIVVRRMALIRDAQVQSAKAKAQQTQASAPIARSVDGAVGSIASGPIIEAPDPSRADTTTVRVSAGEIFAPVPAG